MDYFIKNFKTLPLSKIDEINQEKKSENIFMGMQLVINIINSQNSSDIFILK